MKFFLFLFSFAAWAAPDFQDRIQISEVAGPREVKVIRAAGGREQFLNTGGILYAGDEVFAAKGQIVGLEAYDGAKWKIAPGTRLKLEFRQEGKAKIFYWAFQLIQGGMWGLVPKSSGANENFKLKVRTRTAALGIRGTEYLMNFDEKRSALDVLEGTVWWGRDSGFAKGTYKIVVAGQHAEMDSNGRVFIRDSKPVKGSLPEDYGLVLGKDEKQKVSGSAEYCFSIGKGWKSVDGATVGECVDRND